MKKHTKIIRMMTAAVIVFSFAGSLFTAAYAEEYEQISSADTFIGSADLTSYAYSETMYKLDNNDVGTDVRVGDTDFYIHDGPHSLRYAKPLKCYINCDPKNIATPTYTKTEKGIFMVGANDKTSAAYLDNDITPRKDDILEYRPAGLSSLSKDYEIEFRGGNLARTSGMSVRFNMDSDRENYYILEFGCNNRTDAGAGKAWSLYKVEFDEGDSVPTITTLTESDYSQSRTAYLMDATVNIVKSDNLITVSVTQNNTSNIIAGFPEDGETKAWRETDPEWDFAGSLIGFVKSGSRADNVRAYITSVSVSNYFKAGEADDVLYADISRPLNGSGVMKFPYEASIKKIVNNGSGTAGILLSQDGTTYKKLADISAGQTYVNSITNNKFGYLKFTGNAQDIAVYTPLDGCALAALDKEIGTALRLGGEDIADYTLSSSDRNVIYTEGKTVIPIRTGTADITAAAGGSSVLAKVTSIYPGSGYAGQTVASSDFSNYTDTTVYTSSADGEVRVGSTDLYIVPAESYQNRHPEITKNSSRKVMAISQGLNCKLYERVNQHDMIEYRPEGLSEKLMPNYYNVKFGFRNANADSAFGLRFNVDEEKQTFYMFTCGAGNEDYSWYLFKCYPGPVVEPIGHSELTTRFNGCLANISVDNGKIKVKVNYTTALAVATEKDASETKTFYDDEPLEPGGFAFVHSCSSTSAANQTFLDSISVTNGEFDDSLVYMTSDGKVRAFYDSSDCPAGTAPQFILAEYKGDHEFVGCSVGENGADGFNTAVLDSDENARYKCFVWDIGDDNITPIVSSEFVY